MTSEEHEVRTVCETYYIQIRQEDGMIILIDPLPTVVARVAADDPYRWKLLLAAALGYAAGYDAGYHTGYAAG